MFTDLHYCPFTLLAARYFPDKDKFKLPFCWEEKISSEENTKKISI